MAEDGGSRSPRYRVRIRIDGEATPLKPFIHDLIGGSLFGMLPALKGSEGAEVIEVRVERRPEEADGPSHD